MINIEFSSYMDIDDIIDDINFKVDLVGYDNLTERENYFIKEYYKGNKTKLYEELIKIDHSNNTIKSLYDRIYTNPVFKINDILRIIVPYTVDSLPEYARRFLRIHTYDNLVVNKLNSSGKVDIGCRSDNGKVFYYSTKRFELVE